MKFLKKLLKPKTLAGKAIGAVTSALGVGGASAAAGLDIEFVIIIAVGVGAGYAFGWSKDQVKGFISFLNSESNKREK